MVVQLDGRDSPGNTDACRGLGKAGQRGKGRTPEVGSRGTFNSLKGGRETQGTKPGKGVGRSLWRYTHFNSSEVVEARRVGITGRSGGRKERTCGDTEGSKWRPCVQRPGAFMGE